MFTEPFGGSLSVATDAVATDAVATDAAVLGLVAEAGWLMAEIADRPVGPPNEVGERGAALELAAIRLARLRLTLERLTSDLDQRLDEVISTDELKGLATADPTTLNASLVAIDRQVMDALDAADEPLGIMYRLARALGSLVQPATDASTILRRIESPVAKQAVGWLIDLAPLLPSGSAAALAASLGRWDERSARWLTAHAGPTDPVPWELSEALARQRQLWHGMLTGRLEVEAALSPDQRVGAAARAARRDRRAMTSVMVANGLALGALLVLLGVTLAFAVVFANGTAVAVIALVGAVLAGAAAWHVVAAPVAALRERLAPFEWEAALAEAVGRAWSLPPHGAYDHGQGRASSTVQSRRTEAGEAASGSPAASSLAAGATPAPGTESVEDPPTTRLVTSSARRRSDATDTKPRPRR